MYRNLEVFLHTLKMPHDDHLVKRSASDPENDEK